MGQRVPAQLQLNNLLIILLTQERQNKCNLFWKAPMLHPMFYDSQMFYKGSRSTDVRDNDAFPQH